MNRKEIDLLLSRIEGLKSFLENNSLENFQQEILNVENYLKRFGSLAELLSHLENVEKIAYAAKEFLNIDEVAAYLQVSVYISPQGICHFLNFLICFGEVLQAWRTVRLRTENDTSVFHKLSDFG